MPMGRTLAVLAEGALWRATHRPWLGWRLVRRLGEGDENARQIAGIMLAKGGPAAIPLLHQALMQGTHVVEVITLLGDVGDASVEAEVARFTADSDERIARAARDALRVLALRQRDSRSSKPS